MCNRAEAVQPRDTTVPLCLVSAVWRRTIHKSRIGWLSERRRDRPASALLPAGRQRLANRWNWRTDYGRRLIEGQQSEWLLEHLATGRGRVRTRIRRDSSGQVFTATSRANALLASVSPRNTGPFHVKLQGLERIHARTGGRCRHSLLDAFQRACDAVLTHRTRPRQPRVEKGRRFSTERSISRIAKTNGGVRVLSTA